ncbi:WRKY DNA-binding transcription factor 70-like [Juglans microcarpa x Juglans regia]|uniref:WRKY DNA-binding transcription factor 70-like n=1 Tax=Juglans microcarpa x Juglans regia TaxID=2249226 RepID=UPI001B7E084F|nr:WRKY DNA-binding transcription factor 70-like [Juglans microcarpa x Juglans regia]
MECCCLPESLPSKPERAIEELTQGRQFATQLRSLLNTSLRLDVSTSAANDLLLKILNSFHNSLLILNSDDGVSLHLPDNNPAPAPLSTESSEGSCRSSTPSTLKDRRGCYKRRKNSESWTKDTPTLLDDGLAWRKYGQKLILNAKFPRNYYRCTHKFDQGCQATKHVQRIQEEPPKYRTTYIGNHTCRTFHKAPELILDSSPFLLSFDSTITNKQDSPFFSSFQPIKQENREDKPSSDDITHNHSFSSDFLVSPDRSAFDSLGHLTALSESDNGDVMSRFMVEPVDFDVDSLFFDF